MKQRLRLATIILLCMSCGQSLYAERSEITFFAGGFLGNSLVTSPRILFSDVQAVLDDEFTGGLRYAYFLNNHFAVEIGGGFTPASVLGTARFGGGQSNFSTLIDIDTYVLHANLTSHLFRGPVIPYVTAGVGAVHFSIDTASFGFLTPSETDFAWNAGGGLKIPISRTTAIRLDSRVFWMSPEFTDEDTIRFTEVSGGVSILFDF